MARYKNILVAFDGSENGLKALMAAKTMKKDHQAHLTVVYVHDQPLDYPVAIGKTTAGDPFMYANSTAPGALPGNMPNIPDEKDVIIVEEEMPNQVIANAKSKLDDEPDVTYEKLVGKPADEIVNYASKNNIELIVIGNRGVGAFQRFFMGSVSEQVLNDSECSVFVVK